MINTKLQNIIDTKSAIGNAIVNKGGTITGETPFFNYAAQINGISTGTPQTIFSASDGSKWALTNAVNLTNVSNNVTSDFNYWQPANNSTSDPILNAGTVGANISGNIQLVQVNQVNIAQYENIVINDTTGAKYVGYNGFDANTNPTPTGNTTFNRWLLNNSATGTILFANTTIVNSGIFNGPNTTQTTDITNMAFVNNSNNYGGQIVSVTTNNGFIYAGGANDQPVKKYYESNLVFVGNAPSYGAIIWSITTNNGFIYAGGFGPAFSAGNVSKYYESNLALVGNTASYGAFIRKVITNNGIIYVGGANDVKTYHESNLVFIDNTVNYGGSIRGIVFNNGFMYVGGGGNNTVQKFYQDNLAFINNTASYGGEIQSIIVNNGFIYAAGESNRTVKKFYEDNLAFVGNTINYNATIQNIASNNGFIYAGGVGESGVNRGVSKFYESNLALVSNTVNYGGSINAISINNGFIYVGGQTNQTVQKFQEQSTETVFEQLTFYTATKIKE
jgi:hypothetical protein